jgi:hypothetical protein
VPDGDGVAVAAASRARSYFPGAKPPSSVVDTGVGEDEEGAAGVQSAATAMMVRVAPGGEGRGREGRNSGEDVPGEGGDAGGVEGRGGEAMPGEGGDAGGVEGRGGDDDEEGSRPDELRSAPL